SACDFSLYGRSGNQLTTYENGDTLSDIIACQFLEKFRTFAVEHNLYHRNGCGLIYRNGSATEVLTVEERVFPACRLEGIENAAYTNGFLFCADITALKLV